MAADFVHLHLHSQFSFLVGSIKVKALAKRAKELGMSAVALTDRASMFGAIRHYQECKYAGIRAILGCELNLAREDGSGLVDHMVMLAGSNDGYRNLVKLVSLGHLESAVEGVPTVKLETVAQHRQGLIALSGCMGGVVPQQILEHGVERAVPSLVRLQEAFEPGHLFVELQDHGLPEQAVLNEALTRAARKLGLPVVGTNDVHFMNRDDGEAQLYLEGIRQGRTYAELKPSHHGSFEMYLKTPDEMAQVFRNEPDALKNTLLISEMCSGLALKLGQPMLPHFQVPDEYDTEGYFRHVSLAGLHRRFAEFEAIGKQVDRAAYEARLQLEMDVIAKMDFPGYFLIVWDFIREAKDRGIPVGPGRGSGAGSLVAYSMGITELDPLPYALLFERFLNPERVSMPDFDIDFCMDRRGEVIEYVSQKYGERSVGQIATFQNLKARSVLKDVARSMGFAPVDSQRIASMIPDLGQGKTATISEALEMEPKLKAAVDADPRIAELVKQGQKLEGLTRHAGMHAAGVVISEGPLYDHVPCFLSDSAIVTQYDKDDVEAAGLVKFDFLGLKTLTVIDIARRLVDARPDRKGRPLDLAKISLDDRDTYQLVTSGDTTGVFQLESSGMQQTLRGLKPDCFEDIVAAVALYRPGPLSSGMVQRFINCKHGKEPVRILDPLVDDVLAPTYGVIVYQEQVMQIAQKLAGYTLGGADVLRRAMGKKKLEEMAKQKSTFVAGAVERGVDAKKAEEIFSEVEGFAAYGFNKSHSAAYAVVTYHTAYLKAHYPAEFFAATMTADKDKIEKVVRTIAEARSWGVSVLPPDVDASELDFSVVYETPVGDGLIRPKSKVRDRLTPRIRFGLGAVRGVGETALEGLFEARKSGGEFRDLFDFASRVDSRRLNKGLLEALVQGGAFDVAGNRMGVTRARTFAGIDRAIERSRSATRDRERGQASLFGALAPSGPAGEKPGVEEYPTDVEEWDRMELLRREKSSLGCYVSGHPMDRYGSKLSRLEVARTSDVAGMKPWSMATVAGVVEGYQERLFKQSGTKAAFFELQDPQGRLQAKVRSDKLEALGPLLKSGEPVLVTGKVSFPRVEDDEDEDEEREPTLLVDSVEPLSDAVQRITKAIGIRLSAEKSRREQLLTLKEVLQRHPGACPVELTFSFEDGSEAGLVLDQLRVTPTDQVLSALERALGAETVELR